MNAVAHRWSLAVCLLIAACAQEQEPSNHDAPQVIEAARVRPEPPPVEQPKPRTPTPSDPKLPRGCIADLDAWKSQLVLGEPNVEVLARAGLKEEWAHSLESVRIEAVELDGSPPLEHFVELRFTALVVAFVFIEREPGLHCSIGDSTLTVVSPMVVSDSTQFEVPEIDHPAEFELVDLVATDRKVIARREVDGDIYGGSIYQSYFELRQGYFDEIFRFTLFTRSVAEGWAAAEKLGTVEIIGDEFPKRIRTVQVTDCTEYRNACRDDFAACAEIGIERCKPARKTRTWRYRAGKYR